MSDRRIDIIRTTSSRPELFKMTTESLLHHLKFDGEIRWLVHEDVTNSERSKKLLEYIKEVGIYDVVKVDNPPILLGSSLLWLLKQTNTPFVFSVEEDWRLIKDLDMNSVYDAMLANDDVNQIAPNKRVTMARKQWFDKQEVVKNGYTLTTNMFWTLIPSLWRMGWIMPKLQPGFSGSSHANCSYGLNTHLQKDAASKGIQCDPDWVMKNTGTYYWAGIPKKFHRWKINEGKMTNDEYDKLSNGFYFQHVGYKPYEPEKWKWPFPLPPRIKSSDGKRNPTNNFKSKWEWDGKVWNPTMPIENPEYEEWDK